MTPDAAAAILAVSPDASRDEIERAYRQRARVSHPDRLAGAPAGDVATANAEFARVSEAHAILLAQLAAGEQPIYVVRGRRSWRLFAAWTALLLIAVTLSFYSTTPFFSDIDHGVRVILLGVCALAAALTGRRGWEVSTLLLLAVTALATAINANFASLVTLQLLIVAVLGLLTVGRRFRPRTRY